MMTIMASYSAEGSVDYFDGSLSKEGYFFDEEDIRARWRGKCAQMLGLNGKEVSRRTFTKLVNNVNPNTDERLTMRNVSNRKVAYDITISMPKSVSLVYAITEDKAILNAVRHANRSLMKMIEADMETQAYQNGKKVYERRSNILFASFEHFLSRPVEDKDLGAFIADPNLHIHNYIINACYDESTQKYKALELGTIHRLAPFYESTFHSILSKGLKDAGYGITRTRDRFEITGLEERKLIDKFSNRTAQVEKIAKIKGINDPRKKSELAAKNRVNKNAGVPEEQLRGIWKDRLTTEELKRINSAKGAGKGQVREISAKKAIDLSLQNFLERQSAAPVKRILGKALSFGYGSLELKDVEKELSHRDNILYGAKQGIAYLTTKEMVLAEQDIIEYASNEKGMHVPLNPDYEPQLDFLNEQQKNAITQLLGSRDGVQLLIGNAGVGKTSLLTEVKKGIEQMGRQLIAVAPSAEASRGVLQDKGFEGSDTIARLLVDTEMQQKLRGNVLLVDEAGMVGTEQMKALFDITKKMDARTILSGDPKQHSSVSHGDALRQLQDFASLKVASVDEIVRQRNGPYRKAIGELAAGQVAKGFQRLDKMGAVQELSDRDERMEALAGAYLKSLEQKRSALVVSPTHAEGRALSEVIRQKLKDAGKIDKQDLLFDTQRNLNLTEAERKDPISYEVGQLLQFHQNQKGGFLAGGKYEVTGVDKKGGVGIRDIKTRQELSLPLDRVDNFQVYEARKTPLAKGDRIRITNNGKTLENTKINNGQTYTVKGFTDKGIQLSNGKTLPKDYRNFQHGYVGTSHSAQGRDAKDLYILQSAESYSASNEKQFYVSASRGVERIGIYTDDKKALSDAISRSGDRMSAKEVAESHNRQRQRQQRQYYRKLTEQKRNYGRQTERNEPKHQVSKAKSAIERS